MQRVIPDYVLPDSYAITGCHAVREFAEALAMYGEHVVARLVQRFLVEESFAGKVLIVIADEQFEYGAALRSQSAPHAQAQAVRHWWDR
jgi:hypothetical protein